MCLFTLLYIHGHKSVTNNLRGSNSLDNFFLCPTSKFSYNAVKKVLLLKHLSEETTASIT